MSPLWDRFVISGWLQVSVYVMFLCIAIFAGYVADEREGQLANDLAFCEQEVTEQ